MRELVGKRWAVAKCEIPVSNRQGVIERLHSGKIGADLADPPRRPTHRLPRRIANCLCRSRASAGRTEEGVHPAWFATRRAKHSGNPTIVSLAEQAISEYVSPGLLQRIDRQAAEHPSEKFPRTIVKYRKIPSRLRSAEPPARLTANRVMNRNGAVRSPRNSRCVAAENNQPKLQLCQSTETLAVSTQDRLCSTRQRPPEPRWIVAPRRGRPMPGPSGPACQRRTAALRQGDDTSFSRASSQRRPHVLQRAPGQNSYSPNFAR